MNPAVAERHDTEVNTLSIEHAVDSEPKEARAGAARPGRRRRWPLIVLFAAAICATGGWYVFARLGVGGEGKSAAKNPRGNGVASLGLSSKAGAEAKDKPSAKVATVPVEVIPQSEVLRLTGSLAADERSSVASNVSGIAAEVRVDRGSRVQKGDVLVQLDPTDAKNRLAEGRATLEELKARLGLDENLEDFDPMDQPEVRLAKASADLAASNLRRAKELAEKKVITDEAYDQTETEYELARQRYRRALLQIKQAYAACKTAMARLAILEKAVADTSIRAPFDGWVAEKLVSVGEQISAGAQATKVVALVRIDPLRLRLTVPQQDVGSVEQGQKVRFRVDSFPDRTFEAEVRYVAPVVDQTRSMTVEAVAPNSDGLLRPGMFVTAELLLGRQRRTIYAPVGAVRRTGEVGRVFVVRDGAAREQVVALGDRSGDKIEIRSGLAGDETLVADPDSVKDGAKVGT